jgi:hypothetical protein
MSMRTEGGKVVMICRKCPARVESKIGGGVIPVNEAQARVRDAAKAKGWDIGVEACPEHR